MMPESFRHPVSGRFRDAASCRLIPFLMIACCAVMAGCGDSAPIGQSGSGSAAAGEDGADRTAAERDTDSGPRELEGQLTLTGSSTVAPLAAEIARRFEEQHPAVRIDVQTGGSSRGIADAASGVADIGMASRSLKAGEQDLLTHQIAIDGICLIAHATSPVGSLTGQQVRAIYRGEVSSWSDAGGEDSPIVVVNKAEGRGTREVFQHHFGLDSAEIDADIIVGDNQQGIKTVAGNPHAIGYVSIGAARAEAELGVPIKLLQADGVAPTADNVASGRFPLTRPLLLLTKDEPAGLQKALLDYAQSSSVTDLIEGLSFVPSHQ